MKISSHSFFCFKDMIYQANLTVMYYWWFHYNINGYRIIFIGANSIYFNIAKIITVSNLQLRSIFFMLVVYELSWISIVYECPRWKVDFWRKMGNCVWNLPCNEQSLYQDGSIQSIVCNSIQLYHPYLWDSQWGLFDSPFSETSFPLIEVFRHSSICRKI